MSATATRRATQTGGRNATTRHIPPKLALAVGMPKMPTPENWSWSALTKLARMESGHTPSRRHPEYWDGTVPWIGIKDAKINHGKRIEDTLQKTNELGLANSSARLLPENTVCLSRTASVGYVLVMGRPMATSQDFVNWVCSDDLDPDFLKYLLIAEGDDILRFASGSVHQTIYFPEAKAFHICHPEVPEQRRIVGILDEAFAGIATAKAGAERNLQNARALFESHLNAVFTKGGKGWVEKPMGDVVLFQGGSQPPKSVFSKERKRGYIRLIQIRDYKSDKHIVYIPEKAGRRRCTADDVMIGRYGPPLFQILRGIDGAYNVALMKATPDETHISKDYLYYFLKNGRILAHVIHSSHRAAGQTGVRKETLQAYPIPYPKSLSRQAEIVSDLKSLYADTRRLESIYQRKLAALDELKKSLLHQAFSEEL